MTTICMSEIADIRFVPGLRAGGVHRLCVVDRVDINNYNMYKKNCCYHICEFAEKMELSGSKVEPVNQSEPSKNKTRNREKKR